MLTLSTLLFALTTAPEPPKTYEYCDKRNRCHELSAVQYNTSLISNHIGQATDFLPKGFKCRVSISLRKDGHLSKLHLLDCQDSDHAPALFKAISDSSPFPIISEAYDQMKEISITINRE